MFPTAVTSLALQVRYTKLPGVAVSHTLAQRAVEGVRPPEAVTPVTTQRPRSFDPVAGLEFRADQISNTSPFPAGPVETCFSTGDASSASSPVAVASAPPGSAGEAPGGADSRGGNFGCGAGTFAGRGGAAFAALDPSPNITTLTNRLRPAPLACISHPPIRLDCAKAMHSTAVAGREA